MISPNLIGGPGSKPLSLKIMKTNTNIRVSMEYSVLFAV